MKLPFTVNWFMGIIAVIHEKYSCCSMIKIFSFTKAARFFAVMKKLVKINKNMKSLAGGRMGNFPADPKSSSGTLFRRLF